MDFNIRMFNPQPEPPAQLGLSVGGEAPRKPHYYAYELKDVIVTSYSTGGAGQ